VVVVLISAHGQPHRTSRTCWRVGVDKCAGCDPRVQRAGSTRWTKEERGSTEEARWAHPDQNRVRVRPPFPRPTARCPRRSRG